MTGETLREHLEAIREVLRNAEYRPPDGIDEHAVAALALLDEADQEIGGAPDFIGDRFDPIDHTRYYTGRRLVADPSPVDATARDPAGDT